MSMVYSNKRKLLLSGWLKENGSVEYNTSLKLQKYLLFYELFAKIDGDYYDLSSLKGYKRGPVFSTVWAITLTNAAHLMLLQQRSIVLITMKSMLIAPKGVALSLAHYLSVNYLTLHIS